MREVNEKNLNPTNGGISFSICVICYLVVSLVFSLIISLTGLETGGDAYIYLSYLVSPVAMAFAVLFTCTLCRVPLRPMARYGCSVKYVLVGVLLVFGLLFSLSWVNDLTVDFFSLFGYEARESASYLPDVSGARIIPVLIVVAVIPAFCEEFFFRGLLLNSVRSGCGDVAAIFLTAMCFSLYHGSPEQTVYQFICGCAFALLAVRSRSLTPTIIIHFLNNALIIVLYAVGATDEAGNLDMTTAWQVTLTVLSAVCLVGSVVYLILNRTELAKKERGETARFFAGAAVGLVVLVVIWVSAFF